MIRAESCYAQVSYPSDRMSVNQIPECRWDTLALTRCDRKCQKVISADLPALCDGFKLWTWEAVTHSISSEVSLNAGC